MKSEDLLASVFPDQVACAENLAGDREVPEHPLIAQTLRDCLDDAMDATGWLALLRRIESGAVEVIARDVPAPSPLAAEALNARPYAFLDDAPIEERRTQAVQNRRYGDPDSGDDLGQLDADAIASVRDEAWPRATNGDEMHEALTALGVVGDGEASDNAGWAGWLDELARAGRATRLRLRDDASVAEPGRSVDATRDAEPARSLDDATGAAPGLWVAAERLAAGSRPLSRRGRRARDRRAGRIRRGLRVARRGVARAAARASRRARPDPRRRPRRPRSACRVATSRTRSSRCSRKASCCRVASRRRCPPAPTSSGASATCWRESIATR